MVADHLSHLVSETTSEGLPIGNTFPDEKIFTSTPHGMQT